jgi:hypothetical protein
MRDPSESNSTHSIDLPSLGGSQSISALKVPQSNPLQTTPCKAPTGKANWTKPKKVTITAEDILGIVS